MAVNKKRKICVLTGTRAEYGLLRSLMKAVMENPDTELQLVVTGTHLVREFGSSVDLIVKDGFPIAGKIPMYQGASDSRENLPASLAKLTDKLGRWLLQNQSDIIVVLGDRIEALGGALAGLTANIPIAHLHGGELATGDMDDRIRFAISSLASLHFVSSNESKRRLLRAGEPSDRIFVVGAMALDEILEVRSAIDAKQKKAFSDKFNFSNDLPLLMIVQHPSGYGEAKEFQYASDMLRVLRNYQGLIIGPNNDPGHSGVRRAIEKFMRAKMNQPRWHFIENIPRQEYLLALASVDVLVGNSSSGIIEANALGSAVVNVGPRQAGRERNGRAIFDSPYDPKEILERVEHAIVFARSHRILASKKFGNGHAGQSIVNVLAKVVSTRDLLVKSHT